jgi:hypothetical protein
MEKVEKKLMANFRNKGCEIVIIRLSVLIIIHKSLYFIFICRV